MDKVSLIDVIVEEAGSNMDYVRDECECQDLEDFREYLFQFTYSELCDTYSFVSRPKRK